MAGTVLVEADAWLSLNPVGRAVAVDEDLWCQRVGDRKIKEVFHSNATLVAGQLVFPAATAGAERDPHDKNLTLLGGHGFGRLVSRTGISGGRGRSAMRTASHSATGGVTAFPRA